MAHNCQDHSEYRAHCFRAENLRDEYEGREAIYIDKTGALRVRVTNILVEGFHVEADAEEIITPGLAWGLLAAEHSRVTPPYRWHIVGNSPDFYHQTWDMGDGGWILHFDPKIVQFVIEFGAPRSNNWDRPEDFGEEEPVDPITLFRTRVF